MELKIIHHTVDLCDPENRGEGYNIQDVMTLAGREAGICYMPEDYFDGKINNSTVAMRRANTILGTGHHSPFDHASIGVEISGIPKILAMILNSMEFYTTSEKSARYTVMKPNNPRELEIYNKWRDIFKDLIFYNYPDMDIKQGEKLALENARYMLSVFTPTSMGYTTTFRQFSYMYYWLNDFIEQIDEHSNNFYKKLVSYCVELRDLIYPLTEGVVKNTKNSKIGFIPGVYGEEIHKNNTYNPGGNSVDMCSGMYHANYRGSFAYLAQAQRHRTLHYEMGEVTMDCFIPPIIIEGKKPESYVDRNLENEWYIDFLELSGEYPQCTLVEISESGLLSNFFLKCKERLCGRAQLEIALKTAELMESINLSADGLDNRDLKMLKDCTENGEVVTKCGFADFKCTEPCRWGKKWGLDRLV